jgi:hypothetical protein
VGTGFLLAFSPPLHSWQHLVGRLIGKQGRYVSFLKQTSGAKIYIRSATSKVSGRAALDLGFLPET